MYRKMAIRFLCPLLLLFGHSIASAETDLLNLGSYAEGTRISYGENMVVVQDEETGEKWLSPAKGTTGRMNIPINLPSDSFEIILEIYGHYGASSWLFFLIADEVQFQFAIHGNAKTRIEGSWKEASVWQKNAKNKARFVVNGGVAKVYVNEVFVQKVTISEEKQGITYTNLMVTNIDQRYILYSLKIKGASDVAVPGSSSSSPSSTATTPTGDCMATYTIDGRLHIPCVSVPGPFGSTQVYQVDLQQRASAFVFDLDLNTVKPR
jgi:hypothetical protein